MSASCHPPTHGRSTLSDTERGDGARPNRRRRLMAPTGTPRVVTPEGEPVPSPTKRATGPGPVPVPVLRMVAIAAGGALGTLARYELSQAVVVSANGFPWATFAVNVAGSLLLGVIITVVAERWPPTRYALPFAAIGFCGGFTTFSPLMVEAVRRAQDGCPTQIGR